MVVLYTCSYIISQVRIPCFQLAYILFPFSSLFPLLTTLANCFQPLGSSVRQINVTLTNPLKNITVNHLPLMNCWSLNVLSATPGGGRTSPYDDLPLQSNRAQALQKHGLDD